MIIVNEEMPTTGLLELKAGDEISNGSLAGVISEIEIQETDNYLLFLISLDSSQQIVIKKLRQVC